MRRCWVAVFVLACGIGCGGTHATAGRDAGAPGPDGSATGGNGGGSGSGGGSGGGGSGSGGSGGGGSGSGGSGGGSGSVDGGSADRSYTLRFVSGGTYSLYASIGGGAAHEVQLDTGSAGIFVPDSVVPSSFARGAACSITYVSSGNTLSGQYVTAPVTLLGASKSGDVTPPPTSLPMSVCAVADASFSGGMMGIGFGRGSSPDPTKNVMWQWADAQAGTLHAGFILSTHPAPQITIGLTAAATAGFALVQLAPASNHSGDWQATSLTGCLTIPSSTAKAPLCGPLLVDTGIPECLLWNPSDATLGGVIAAGQTNVPNGVAMTLSAPSGGSDLAYGFTTGATDAPSAVTVRPATSATSAFSINSGRALLNDYDYLFDVVNGQVGFRHAP